MNLLYTEIEEDLRASVRAVLTDHCPPSAVLARLESDSSYDASLWELLASLGALGLHVPEEHGGQGASLRETAVVLEELGRFTAPVPFLGSAVLATTALVACESDLVASLASGTTVGALAVPLTTAPGSPFPATVSVEDGLLTGRVTSVVDAGAASLLVVPVEGPALYAVRADSPGVTVTEVVSLDMTRRIADVSLASTPGVVIASGDRATAAVQSALRVGAGLLASEQVGIAEACLEQTVRYVKERHQFGRAIGSFQAIKHRLADLWLELVCARATARHAADVLATGSADADVAVALAQSECSELAVRAAEETVQLHGGIGMTWEHPAHLSLKRAKVGQLALGTPGEHRRTLGRLVHLPMDIPSMGQT
ncbi:acyl-CoA dehydrogenase family protein [Allokutzneria multivorans]|uniref:Acyl-CoA dehydrogenase family protein n=1 Tax=Allokutzneria multivorans TaxID=1142134 RepID=A0ABP7T492_9PSEU